MNRRAYLRAAAGVCSVAAAGCIGPNSSSQATTHLEAPDSAADPENLPYPGYAQALPEVTLRDPLDGTDVTTTEFDDRNVVMTFFYSNCNTVCPLLVSSLSTVQDEAAAGGYSDDVVLLAVTFDPVRDDAARLEEYGEMMKADYEADNWHFLRPASEERAQDVVNDTFGVGFQKTGAVESNEYMYDHMGLIVLANKDPVVERSYVGSTINAGDVVDDLERLRDEQA